MKNLFLLFSFTLLLSSCSLIETSDKKAIKICQQSKIQIETNNDFASMLFSIYGLGTNATWLDFANIIAKKNNTVKYNWYAEKSGEENIFIVSFIDEQGWGHRWEVDVAQNIVKYVNQNEYLSRKYGLSRFGGSDEFEVVNIQQNELKIKNKSDNWGGSSDQEVVYVIKASVLNKTDKIITSASLNGKLKLIFKEKTIEEEGNYNSGFKKSISENNPWEPSTSREFYIYTNGMEKMYLNYLPEYVLFCLNLTAEDPVGYKFDKDIAENDLKETWQRLSKKGNQQQERVSDNLKFLLDMDGKYPDDVKLLEVPLIENRVKKLIGERFDFMKTNWSVESPMKIKDNYFIASACQAHNCYNTQFIIVIDLYTDIMSVGIREELHATTFSESNIELPPPITFWISDTIKTAI